MLTGDILQLGDKITDFTYINDMFVKDVQAIVAEAEHKQPQRRVAIDQAYHGRYVAGYQFLVHNDHIRICVIGSIQQSQRAERSLFDIKLRPRSQQADDGGGEKIFAFYYENRLLLRHDATFPSRLEHAATQ